jgi:subtilisin family serine protease
LEGRDLNGAPWKADLNIRGAWPITRGAGVTLAVVDLGVDLPHVELSDRAVGAPHYNFVENTLNGLPPDVPQPNSVSWAHGTAVAGLAVASLNVGRMAGAAPEAGLASWVIFEPDLNQGPLLVDDVTLGDMFQYANNLVAVQNHSWNRRGAALHPLTAAEQFGVNETVEVGRGGRGVVLVRSAGNERWLGANVNDDGYAQDPRIVAVAGVYDDGRAIESSEPGACVLVAAAAAFRTSGTPNGLLTTDLRGTRGINMINFFPPDEDLSDYAFNSLGFAGTSAASPLVAGTVTLMLAANPELTVRDVQQILTLSARHFDLADPDLTTNAAGFVVSHNVGFGIPDAAHAVRLTQNWVNRPAATQVKQVSTTVLPVPDSGLGVEIAGGSAPVDWSPITGLPGTGPHPDDPTPWLPLKDLGTADPPITEDLSGYGALILRGAGPKGLLVDQLQRVADAGAGFGILYNYPEGVGDTNSAPGGDALTPLGGTDFLPMPVMFIGHTDGERLRAFAETHGAARARMRLDSVQQAFTVQTPLICEQVGVRLKTDHSLRGDLRITLMSPGGTRSVLQRFNGDLNPGPVDWTYWSTHHLGESSVGHWTLAVGDEFLGETGSVLESTLIIRGVPISDSDADGLDDLWETSHLGDLSWGPRDDPDDDGYINAFEQLANQDPDAADFPFEVDLSRWNEAMIRLSWPGRPGLLYEVWSGSDPRALTLQAEVAPRIPETEWFVSGGTVGHQFFQVRAIPAGP